MQPPRAAITTILFTDLVNSTELMQQVGDETAQQVFQAHHALLQDAVVATGGDELQWMGDGLMVAFASSADAVRCATAMQQAARQRVGEHQLEIRVGLNVGETLQQESGSGYFGTPVVIAKRLCDKASAGQILCTSTVAGLLTGRAAFHFRDLGPAELKGLAEPVGISEVLYQVEEAGPPLRRTPFVGRRDESARLDAALAGATAGSGGLLMLAGEPGIGKTRTLEEFAARARQEGAQVLWGSCYEGDRDPPYCPFAEAISEHARRASPEELEKDLGPYGGSVAKLAPELRTQLPELPEPPALGPDEERHRLFDAVAQFLFALARRAPLVLVVDDLHWADRGAIALLRHLARYAARHPILLIGAYRDVELDRQHPLADALGALRREAEYERILLRGLGNDDVGALLETLADHEVPRELGDAIHVETDGNPFFIREVILHLVEEGKLTRSDGRWNTSFRIEELGIPEGVREVIGRRLSRLSEEANKLLTAASGFNGCFRFAAAAAVAGLDEAAALDALDEAFEAQLLRSGGRAEEYDFNHSLIRHTLYAELNPSRQVRLHRRIAEELERFHGHDAGDVAGEIAQQYQRSAVLPGAEKGAAHALVAADRAEASAAFGESAVFLRMALELLPEQDERRPRVLGRLGLALAWGLELEQAVAAATEAGARIAASEGDDAAADYLAQAASAIWGASWSPLAWQLAEQGMRYIGARRDLTWLRLRALDIVRREAADPDFPGMPPDSPERREVSEVMHRYLDRIGWVSEPWGFDMLIVESRQAVLERYREILPLVMVQAGCIREVLPRLGEETQRALGRGQLAAAALFYNITARMQAALGEFARAQDSFRSAVQLAERIQPLPYLALQMSAFPLEYGNARGEPFDGPVGAIPGLRATDARENTWVRAVVGVVASLAAAMAGRAEQALALVGAALPAVEAAGGWAVNYPFLVCGACQTLWQLERTEHIEVLERNLLAKIVEPDFRYIQYDGRLAMAWLCALQGRHDEAVAWFEKARRVTEEQGARPLRALIDYYEAEMFARRDAAGDRERVSRLLECALEQFRSVDMPGWILRAEALAAQF